MKKPFAKKSLGQNFLQDSAVRQQILDVAGDLKGKKVLEIGPGLGFLTTKLLTAGAKVTAIELDPRAVKILQKEFGHMDTLHLVQGDILDQPMEEFFSETSYQVVANIPYNITAPLLRKFLAEETAKPTSLTLMVQKEVAQKICDPKKRSILSLSVEIFAEAKLCFIVGRECFSPVPRVDSAVIYVQLREIPLIPPALQKDFFKLINMAFAQKRKMIGNSLQNFCGKDVQALLGDIDPSRRPETLLPAEWLQITQTLHA